MSCPAFIFYVVLVKKPAGSDVQVLADHTCISMLTEACVDQTMIKKIAGHAGDMRRGWLLRFRVNIYKKSRKAEAFLDIGNNLELIISWRTEEHDELSSGRTSFFPSFWGLWS